MIECSHAKDAWYGVERAHIILTVLKELQSAWYGVLDFDSMMHVIAIKHPAWAVRLYNTHLCISL